MQYNVPWKVTLADSGLAWGLGLHRILRASGKKWKETAALPQAYLSWEIFSDTILVPPAGIHFPYRQATKLLHCVDDTGSVFYNSFVGENEVKRDSAGRFPWRSSEAMKMDSIDYKYGIVVKHNPHSIPGKGSCIFLHVIGFDSLATSGCTAMGEKNFFS